MSIEQLRADNLFQFLLLDSSRLQSIQHILSDLMLIGICFLLVYFFIQLIRKVVRLKYAFTEPTTLLELIPPAKNEKSSYTTQQLFSAIHDLLQRKSIPERVFNIESRVSLEIISTKELGIRYLVLVPKKHEQNIRHHLLSYLPQVKVAKTSDYMQSLFPNKRTIELSLAKHAAFPLQKQMNHEEHDPVAYITGMMTKLSEDELLSLQMVLTASKFKEKTKLLRMIYRGEDILNYLNSFHFSSSYNILLMPFLLAGKGLLLLITALLGGVKTVVNDFSNAQLSYRQAQLGFQTQLATQAVKANLKPARVITPFEQNAIQAIEEKIEQKVFSSEVRFLISMKSTKRMIEREQGLLSSLSAFTGVSEQQLRKRISLPFLQKYLSFLYQNRLSGMLFTNTHTILSLSELADLYHFPISSVNKTENLVKTHSRELPAPLSLKKQSTLDTYFAKNTFGGVKTLIGLSQDERRRHMYIIGATGTGKSTLLLSMIAKDIQNGKGVAVVDPHGELAETVLSYIPEDRVKDVIYFNPDDLKYPIGLNLLELTSDLDEEDTLREKEFIAESVVSLFRKVFSDSMVGNPHRIEYILRNTIHTAFTVKDRTLFTIFDLLNDPIFQQNVVRGLKDENLKNFWKHEFGKAGDYQKVKMISPITSRIGRFLFSPSAKRILEQTSSTINFDDIMNSGKILVCNLSKGKLGEDTSQVLGIMLLNKIQLASLKRARVKSSERRDFYLYVDEFQNFATKSFIDILSESRKYKLNLTMAEQSTSQLRDKHLVQTILANAGTIISFKTANPEDERLLLPQFHPYIEQGEIANLPAFHFYMKNSAINPEEPFSGETVLLDTPSNRFMNQIIQSSRKNFATVYTPKHQNIENENDTLNENAVVSSGLPA